MAHNLDIPTPRNCRASSLGPSTTSGNLLDVPFSGSPRNSLSSNSPYSSKQGLNISPSVSMSNLVATWGQRAEQHDFEQKLNPFSDKYEAGLVHQLVNKNQEGYGRPKPGSKTEARGFAAHAHIEKEMEEMCKIIQDLGEKSDDGSKVTVLFGDLFRYYVRVSSKVVGTLLRARKRGLLTFEGETLFQGRDDMAEICLWIPYPLVQQKSDAPALVHQ